MEELEQDLRASHLARREAEPEQEPAAEDQRHQQRVPIAVRGRHGTTPMAATS